MPRPSDATSERCTSVTPPPKVLIWALRHATADAGGGADASGRIAKEFARALGLARLEDALAVIDGMLLLAPESAPLWREAGLINAGLGNLNAAVAAMERVLAIGGDNLLMHEAAAVLQRLKARLN